MCFCSLILMPKVNFFLEKVLLITERLLLHLHNCDNAAGAISCLYIITAPAMKVLKLGECQDETLITS